jgi:hypothetical protein
MDVEGRHGLRRGRHLLQQAQAVHSSSRRTSSSRCSSNRLEQRAKIQGIGSWTAERIRRLRTVEGTRQCVWMRTLLLCMRFFIRASHATVVRIFDPRAQFGFARAVLFSFWYRLFYANCNTSFFFLIIIISGLVMHNVTELINYESNQRYFLFNLNLNHQIRANRYLV